MSKIAVSSTEKEVISVSAKKAIPLAIKQATGTSSGGGSINITPYITMDGSSVVFNYFTPKQMAEVYVWLEGGLMNFEIGTDEEGQYSLLTKSDIQELDGMFVMGGEEHDLDTIIDTIPVDLKGHKVSEVRIEGIDADLLNADFTWKLAEIGNKLDNIKLPEIDTTELAKQGSNAEATNSAIYALLSQFGESVLQEKVTVILNCQENIVWQDYAVNVTFEDGRTQAVPLSESGTCTFSIKIGQNYSVQLPVIGVFITPALQTYTAITSSRDIYWSYLTTGVFGLDELGRRYSIEQIEVLEDKSIIKYAGFTNNNLENSLRGDGNVGNGFIWNLNNYIIGEYQWSTSNNELDTNLMPIVTSENIANFADGATYTRNLILATAQANLSSPAALQCSSQSITIGNEQKKGFLISPYQYYQFRANLSSVQLLYNALGITFPDDFGTGYYCTSGQGVKSPIFSYGNSFRFSNEGFAPGGIKTKMMKCFCIFQL